MTELFLTILNPPPPLRQSDFLPEVCSIYMQNFLKNHMILTLLCKLSLYIRSLRPKVSKGNSTYHKNKLGKSTLSQGKQCFLQCIIND